MGVLVSFEVEGGDASFGGGGGWVLGLRGAIASYGDERGHGDCAVVDGAEGISLAEGRRVGGGLRGDGCSRSRGCG